MTRPRLALAALGTALLAAAIAAVPEAPSPPGAPPVANAREPERVRIEHEFVQIPVSRIPAPPARKATSNGRGEAPVSTIVAASGRAAPISAPSRTAFEPAGDPERTASRGGLLSRAVRSIVGDGRHKPQPFPSVNSSGGKNQIPR